ncbi:osmotically inducible protein OsmC [candidate division KSB1 bacterium]|nr:osmotically inducible protein OsmC [candidate division KSB1 bacterium]
MNMEVVFPSPNGKRVDAKFKGFTIKTDQPSIAGGQGSAPAPFDLFLASIGTCAGIYILNFCQQRDLNTDGIRIVQKMERDRQKGMIDNISLEIELPPDFPEKYKDAVIRSAELCAVKKHIQDPPEFNIKTKVVSPDNL